MPNRILRDGILRSERIAKISPLAELFYRRIMSVVDDFGRYYAIPALLLSDVFPLRPSWADESMVGLWLAECREAELMALYCVKATPYLEIAGFDQRIRPGQRSKFPEPAESSGEAREKSAYARATTTPSTTATHSTSNTEFPDSENQKAVIKTDEVMDEFHPVAILAEAKAVYRSAGLPIPDKHDVLILQYLTVITPREKRGRVMNYVKWNLAMGRWPSPAKTKAFLSLLQSPTSDWDVELTVRTLPNAREPSRAEQATDQAMEEFRKLHPEIA